MTTKDYYEVMRIGPDATDAEIKRAYRSLALRYHPDRNLDRKKWAEERFKEISEAYGVLIDPVKRRQYDSMRRSGFGRETFRSSGGYTMDDIYCHIFSNPYAQEVFQDLGRYGVRIDEDFLRHTFFGGRGVFFGGFFSWGPFGGLRIWPFGPLGFGRPRSDLSQGAATIGGREERGLASSLLRRLGGYLLRGGLAETHAQPRRKAPDIHYRVRIAPEAAARGEEIFIACSRGEERKKLKVKIPPGTTSGTRLRLRGQGGLAGRGEEAGDLYLDVMVD